MTNEEIRKLRVYAARMSEDGGWAPFDAKKLTTALDGLEAERKRVKEMKESVLSHYREFGGARDSFDSGQRNALRWVLEEVFGVPSALEAASRQAEGE